MRLFIALELPEAVAAELGAVQQRLRRARSHPVRWVDISSIHLTLQFLGEVEEERAPAICAALAAPDHAPPPRLHLTRAGAFPNLKRPNVVWVGVGGELAALNRLQQAVVASLEPLGFVPEDRPFRAHLTLGRVQRDATTAQRQALGTAIEALPAPGEVAWQSGPPVLFQSVLSRGGTIYHKLGP